MNLRQALKRSGTAIGLVNDSRRVMRIPTLVRRHGLIRQYLASHPVRKLQLGAGTTRLDGWLSTDIEPQADHVVFMDATKPYPLDDATFDHVFSEHMIEHVSWQDGQCMLRECRRVLKPGGAIRIATPDLAVLLELYRSQPDGSGERYVKWITDTFLAPIDVYKPSFVINNAFRNWGHQFLYDGNLLELALRQAGFTDVRRCPLGESDDPHLRGLESHGRNVEESDMVAFETMVYEARRPREGAQRQPGDRAESRP